ncbi:MAG: hypothetical protein GX241_02220 [Ruminococcaceae bacterium]|nr:hypothetical protein [Oscillospiraceae bacterium]
MTVIEKVAYLRGLAEGLNLNSEKAETKMFAAIIDVLEDLADEQMDIDDTIDIMAQQLDEVDADLGDLEELIYIDCDCGCHDDFDFDDDYNGHHYEKVAEGTETEYYEVECPACRETICVDEGILSEGGIECPSCGESLEFEIDFEEEAAE